MSNELEMGERERESEKAIKVLYNSAFANAFDKTITKRAQGRYLYPYPYPKKNAHHHPKIIT
jgi:hypothetical protein